MTVRFDDAWRDARVVAIELADRGIDVILIRDILGRVSLLLDLEEQPDWLEKVRADLQRAAGAFASPTPVQISGDLFVPEQVLNSPDLLLERSRVGTHGSFSVLENGIVGADWTRRTADMNTRRRVTLYGFKGGVGRSTATFMLGKGLASQGKCVLIVDLDLESPGISWLTQADEDLSAHGIVDHLVEDAVGNADGLQIVSRSQRVTAEGNGEVWIAPAAGTPRADYDYMAKLNRIYTDLPPAPDGRAQRFGNRLDAAIRYAEAQVETLSRKPDVVLLDSRAGIHDVAAVALTQLSDLNLLFAADTPQTWRGYGSLFAQWKHNPRRRDLGERLKMVASLTPAATVDEYLADFRDHAQVCFAETLYEDTTADELDAFNYSVNDPDAPHSPIPILFHSDLVGLDPTRDSDWHARPLIKAAFERFVDTVSTLIIEEDS
ncbi:MULTISPECIES: KGGVGR-motif variant AAA ATPase [Amycolatopsis]|uniref:KGGVGR-motif variant AAA ATPase n=1 Tax=Amycolatopsis TaxID=1813 RepID=UPI000B8AA2D9|nr:MULTISPECIES: P-loop NTPase [Amycolatopsis]OXM73867.1 hypothetical protein CF166_08005 [Amycolatopsis sp. KNN50.9b]